jgi:hypothetical protein
MQTFGEILPDYQLQRSMHIFYLHGLVIGLTEVRVRPQSDLP